uniref:induced myeloid leukemia cell differentiation protein Mcl-1 homolog n=1 Tax=Pristiophorus japonicus TaxID=55135 RepID=UPI00398F1B90
MEQTMLALQRSSSSAFLQLQNQFYCPGGGTGTRVRGAACGLAGGSGGGATDLGSLPHTPDTGSPADERPEPLFPLHDALWRRSYGLVRGFVWRQVDDCGGERGGGGAAAAAWPKDDGGDELQRRAAATLQQVGDRLIRKHGTAFAGMVNRLNVSGRSDLHTIQRVATEMFIDGEVNWGRVVSFIAFGAVLGGHLKKINQEDCIDDVAVQITDYLMQQKREWLETHGGWEGFTQFFHENNAEDSAKKALMWIAGFGIAGAGILHLLR